MRKSYDISKAPQTHVAKRLKKQDQKHIPLSEFFRQSPLADVDLERDRSSAQRDPESHEL